MTTDWVSLVYTIAISVLAGGAGYWGRIAQKIEDRRDKIFLDDIPAIYSLLLSFTDALITSKGIGDLKSLGDLKETLTTVNKDLKEKIYSGNIIVFEKELYSQLRMFYQDSELLLVALTEIVGEDKDKGDQESSRATFFNVLKDGGQYPFGRDQMVEPKTIADNADKLVFSIKARLDKYKSYSWRLTILILAIGVLLGVVEVLKGLIPGKS